MGPLPACCASPGTKEVELWIVGLMRRLHGHFIVIGIWMNVVSMRTCRDQCRDRGATGHGVHI
jgi:hypothetical protein